MTADHAVRPIIVPRDVNALPWNSGYAETINAGKSKQNEDQACVREGRISVIVGGKMTHIPYTLMSVYDGHAGAGCAVTASNDLWQVGILLVLFYIIILLYPLIFLIFIFSLFFFSSIVRPSL